MRLLVLLAVLSGVSGPLAAQEDLRILDERNREVLHPASDPTVVSGLVEGPDGFRSATPALAATDGEVTYIDADVLYRRRVAMYEQGATFNSHVPPPRETRERPRQAQKLPAPLPDREEKTLDEDGSASLLVIACLLGVMMGTLIFIRRV